MGALRGDGGERGGGGEGASEGRGLRRWSLSSAGSGRKTKGLSMCPSLRRSRLANEKSKVLEEKKGAPPTAHRCRAA